MSTASSLKPMADKLGRRARLGSAEREAILALPHRVTGLGRASFISREGERVSHCCLLLSGFAYCHRTTGDGSRQILSIHLAGDLLDLQNGAAEFAPCNVQALSSVKVAYIPRSELLSLAAKYPQIAAALWADTGVNASILSEWLLNVGQRPARSRISHLVCEMALRQKHAGLCAGPEYEWMITQEQLGDATGLTSVHVNRTLQALRKDGLLQTSQGRVRILDWQALQAEGDFTPGYLQLGSHDTLRELEHA